MKKISHILNYLKDYKGSIFLYFLCSLLAILFSLFSLSMLAPVLQVLFLGADPSVNEAPLKSYDLFGQLKQLINTTIVQYDRMQALTFICVALLIAIILKNVFTYWAIYLLSPIRNAVIRRLRDDMFNKMISLPISYFTNERKGDLTSRMTNDINEVEISVISVLESFIKEPLTLILYITTMVIISPQLSIFIFVFLPVASLIIAKITKALRKQSLQSQEALGKLMNVMDETIGGIRVVKAFNAEKAQLLKFRVINNALFRIRNKIAARRELAAPTSEVLGITVVCVILWYGGSLIFSEKGAGFTAELFLTYIALFSQLILPFKNLSTAFSNIRKGSGALARIEEVMAMENAIKETDNPKELSAFTNSIEFKNVSFQYKDKPVLHNINLRIPKGQTIAIVGASGAGKSTLADLIPRFQDATNGQVLIDGVDVKDLSLRSVRALMGIVTQEAILFNDTIQNNIALGTGGATKEQIIDAAKAANALSFIDAKPGQLDFMAGERGMHLSGGERQRITIARALLKNPPILILDEATSSLDTQSERIVQDAINQLTQNRTVVVIAHRLSTIKNADQIVVLDKGHIVEQGTHEALMQQKGYYYELVTLQAFNQ